MRALPQYNVCRHILIIHQFYLCTAGAQHEVALRLLPAMRKLFEHHALQARVVAQTIPRESRTADIAFNDAMHRDVSVALCVKSPGIPEFRLRIRP